MQQMASAYAKVAQATQSPRELEASVLMKAAIRLQAVKDDWEGKQADLEEALAFNRKIWTILVTSVTRPDSPVPLEIKQNVVNLGLFVFNHSIRLSAAAAPEKLTVLININRELAAGLRGMAPPPQAAA